MKSIYGDIINFEYAAPNHRTDYLGPTQYYYYYLENNYSNFNYFADRAFTSTSKTTYDERKLVAIKTKSTTLRFHYNNDISLLESISVHKNDSPSIPAHPMRCGALIFDPVWHRLGRLSHSRVPCYAEDPHSPADPYCTRLMECHIASSVEHALRAALPLL